MGVMSSKKLVDLRAKQIIALRNQFLNHHDDYRWMSEARRKELLSLFKHTEELNTKTDS